MAEFSLEYVKEAGDVGHDFSILEEFSKLQEGFYIPIICEGFGILAIGRTDNKCTVFFEDTWYEFDTFLENRLWEK